MNSQQTNRSIQPLQNKIKLRILSDMLHEHLEDLFGALYVDYQSQYDKYIMRCPIHGGSNLKLNVNSSHHEYPGNWVCWSHKCHECFNKSILGFIRGVLSARRLGWATSGDDIISFGDTLKWCEEFLGVSLDSLEVSQESLERFSRNDFARQFGKVEKSKHIHMGITRETVRRNLILPAEYYLEKGYTASLLDQYDVGLRVKPGADFHERVVIPLYEESGNYLVGATSRSIHPECPKCKLHHSPTNKTCPITFTRFRDHAKWRHTDGFDKSNYLFNHWKNLGLTRQRRSIILCESIGDVLRLEDSGIRGAVALFGCELSSGQQALLDQAGVMTLIILLNNDPAGLNAAEKIKEKYRRYYRIYFPNLLREGKNDYGDLCGDEITRDVKPILEGLMK